MKSPAPPDSLSGELIAAAPTGWALRRQWYARSGVRSSAGVATLVMGGRFITNVGFFMVVPLLTVFVVGREHMSGGQAGVLFSAFVLSRRGLGLFAGWASDRIGAAVTLSAGLAIEAVAYASFGLAGRSFSGWLLAVTVLGSGGALNNNGARSLLAGERGTQATVNLSRYYASINAAGLIGPLIGTALLAGGLMQIGFAVAAGLHLLLAGVSAALLRGFHSDADPSRRASPRIGPLLRDRATLVYCALAAGSWFLISQYRVLLPLDLLQHRVAGSVFGLFTALNALVVMTAVFAGARRLARRSLAMRMRLLSVGAVVLGGGWMLCALPGLPAIVAAVIVTSLGESLFCSVVDANIVSFAPEGSLGVYLGLSSLAWGLGGALAGVTGGVFAFAAHQSGLVFLWAAVCAVGVLTGIGTHVASPWFLESAHARERTAVLESAA